MSLRVVTCSYSTLCRLVQRCAFRGVYLEPATRMLQTHADAKLRLPLLTGDTVSIAIALRI